MDGNYSWWYDYVWYNGSQNTSIIVFFEKEWKEQGKLPYLICWISANRTPTMLYKSTLEEVYSQKQHLLSLGFADNDISIMINFSACGVINKATGKEK